MWKFVHKWPLCQGNVLSFLAQSSILSVEMWVKHLILEGDSACNLVNLFLGTFMRIRINIPFQIKRKKNK